MAEILFARLDEIIPTIDNRALLKANNLDDLDDLPTALVNLGLENVDNTSDADKPISDATQAALDGKQPLDATLTAFAGITFTADTIAYATGADAFSTTALTSYARTLLDDADALTARGTLDAQQANVNLTSISGVTAAADKLPYFTGASSAAVTDLSAFARTILDDADAAAVRTTIGVAIGSDVQAYDADLAGIAGLTFSNGDILYYDGGFKRLPKGTDSQYLFLSGGIPAWTNLTGGGDLLSTNNLSDVASAPTALVNLGLPADPNADRILFWDDSAGGWRALSTDAGFVINGTVLSAVETIGIAASDETIAITAGTNKATFSLPYAFTVTSVYASVNTASSSGAITIDINEAGTTILSTKLTIDQSEKTSATAATPPVISDASIAANAEIGIDIDGAGTGATGLKVFIVGYRT